jgi:hypothetical protein
MAQKHTCALCGGPVGEDGRTLASTPPVRMEPRKAAAFASPARPDDDPLQHLTPVERYARAIERRNTLIRDRRTSERPGRRHTDQHPAAHTETEESPDADGR